MGLNAEILIALITMLMAMLTICTILVHAVKASYEKL